MAVEESKNFGSRKRRRGSAKKRLLPVNEKVEVRSLEVGFLGSWHPGTVIKSGKQKRHVLYDNVLDDDGLDYLVEEVGFPAVLDSISSSNCNKRGLIRPLPPLIEFRSRDLTYGLCVDVNYQEAWWEGVIFDHCDGMDERSIFFPDLGDEMKIGIDKLRTTQEWDEVTENWEQRGKWIFLELVEECEQTSYVAVSVKQIWYDVRTKRDFDKIREWTFNVKDSWRDLVMEVVSDYLSLTLKEIFHVLDLSRNISKEITEPEAVEPTANVDLNEEIDMANFKAVVDSGNRLSGNTNIYNDASSYNSFGSQTRIADIPVEQGDWSNFLGTDGNSSSIFPIQENFNLEDGTSDRHIMAELKMSCPEKEVLVQKEPLAPVQDMLPEYPQGICCKDAGAAGQVISDASCYKKRRKYKCSTRKTSVIWQPLILTKVEFCPDAVNQYALASGRKSRKDLKEEVRKHLAYLGWKIEWTEDLKQKRRYRYSSPDEHDRQVYMSLFELCKHMKEDINQNYLLSQDDQRRMHPTVDSGFSHLPHDQPKKSQNPDVAPPIMLPPPSVEVLVKPEFCPQAVVEYYMLASDKRRKADKKNMILKAKKHLLAAGWKFDYPTKRRKYCISPENESFGSLRQACKVYIKESIPKWINSGMRPLDVSGIMEENISQVDGDNLFYCVSQLLQMEPKLHDIADAPVRRSAVNQKGKDRRNLKASQPKLQRKGLPKRVLRSSKRVQKVCAPCMSRQKPQNVLSWLIDSNLVLPRAKVYYWARGRHHPAAEGRITHDGIKCSCCQKVYSLGGFELHATGSSGRGAAASILLKDGKSLLDCQMEIMHDHRMKETTGKPCNDICPGENDYICSVCHYGGELVLCDQCPSAFHQNCLGLEDIPDGDWFCPSCCCGICSQSKIEGAEDAHAHFLTCIQCEHKYHVGCLRNRGVDKSRRHLENWLCSEHCEKIYVGLHKLLGVPVAVGVNNLTWTLMKCVNYESCDLDNTDKAFLAESYSKLNVALAVMHECFEPLKERYSSRDLMEDVLFSRWSELNRLNFRGFYTVLLERNEELISVATVRVYGEKVAEVPLVGTRFPYRRLGMCRILMNELERRLLQLGVERLVLPAVPGVLDTWTSSFGFSKMTNSERSQFLDYTFLDFQDTVMCQKLLKIPSPDSVLPRETEPKQHDVISVSGSIDFDSSSPVSEVYQSEGIDKSGMLNLQLVDIIAGNKSYLDNGAIEPDSKLTTLQGKQCKNGISPECSLEYVNFKKDGRNDSLFKFYHRRKVSKS